MRDGGKTRQDFINGKREWLRGRYEEKVASLNFFETAARPPAGSGLGPAHGLDGLLELWASRPRLLLSEPPSAGHEEYFSEFDRYDRAHPAAGRGEA